MTIACNSKRRLISVTFLLSCIMHRIILVWLFIVTAIQIIMCKYIFVDKREKSSKVLPVTNRWSNYHTLLCFQMPLITVSIHVHVQEPFQLVCLFLFCLWLHCGLFWSHPESLSLHVVWNIAAFSTGYQHYDERIPICWHGYDLKYMWCHLPLNLMWSWCEYIEGITLAHCCLVFWYTGHRSYKGFLYVEHTYNNPILNTFVVLLLGSLDKQQHSRQRSYGFEFGSIQQDAMHLLVPVKKCKARQRIMWCSCKEL